jgi:S-DNA-T family DNA segregation ATPase FtsK/SpoIIIE
MANKKKAQFSVIEGVKDERFPKLVGLLFLFLTLYLFVAYTSYLFTWQDDFDKAQQFSILWSPEIKVDNALGRLGAFISYFSFTLGFGISSYMIVYACFATGMGLIIGKKFRDMLPLYRQTFITMLWTSFVLAFIFQKTSFYWGGTWGKVLVEWSQSLIGSVGVIVLLVFVGVGLLVWNKNPDFSSWTSQSMRENVRLASLWQSFRDLWARRPRVNDLFKTAGDEADTEKAAQAANISEEPAKTNKAKAENTTKTANVEVELEADEEDQLKGKPTPVATDISPDDLEDKIRELTSNQLDFSVRQALQKEKEESGDADQLNTSRKTNKNSENNGENTAENNDTEAELEIEINDEADSLNLQITAENTAHFEPYDSTLDLPNYENPVLDLLESYDDQKPVIDRAELETNKDQIIETLLHYKIEILKIKATIGPTVTLYEIVPAPGVRISKIKNLEDDIALSLAALGIRIIAPIPGKGTIGIEVPNRNKQVVSLKEVLASPKFRQAKMDLPIALGKTISNEVFVADLAKMPHLLVAGATGQGKSVGINAIIMSLLYKKHPSQLKLILIDPKKVELSLYNRISDFYLGYLPGEEEAIVTDTSKVVQTLHSLTIEMDTRYNLLKKASVRNITEYNQKFIQRRLNPEKGHQFLPYIVLVIDEFADIIMTAGKEVELPIARLAQLARAVGIHLIIATQRPSVNIITGVIKANFPARLAFKVTSKIDSRTILDSSGAEQLIGRGDMLLYTGSDLVRIQCAFIDTPEVERVIDFISSQKGYPQPFLLPEFSGDEESSGDAASKLTQTLNELDEFFEDAARLVVSTQQGSTSMIQRRMKLGFNRAGRIMDQLENTGIVGASEGSKARQVHISDEIELEQFLKSLKERRNRMF